MKNKTILILFAVGQRFHIHITKQQPPTFHKLKRRLPQFS